MPVRRAGLTQCFRSAPEEVRKNRVLSDAAEPIRGVPGVRLDAVDDAVPVASFGGVNILRDGMALRPATEPEKQAG